MAGFPTFYYIKNSISHLISLFSHSKKHTTMKYPRGDFGNTDFTALNALFVSVTSVVLYIRLKSILCSFV